MLDRASRFSLQDKRALVTGASRGIGVEIATVFADAGADVAIVGRDAEGLETTRQAIAGKGRRCVEIQADLRTIDGARTPVESRYVLDARRDQAKLTSAFLQEFDGLPKLTLRDIVLFNDRHERLQEVASDALEAGIAAAFSEAAGAVKQTLHGCTSDYIDHEPLPLR